MGNRILELLTESNISQKEFAQKLHIAPSTLNGYLKGHRSPDYQTLMQIADFFNVSTDYLLGRDNPHELKNDEKNILKLYSSLNKENKKLSLDIMSVIAKRSKK